MLEVVKGLWWVQIHSKEHDHLGHRTGGHRVLPPLGGLGAKQGLRSHDASRHSSAFEMGQGSKLGSHPLTLGWVFLCRLERV